MIAVVALRRPPVESKHALVDTSVTILIVDDDADIRTIARLALTRIGGFAVHEAASGTEALSAISRERFSAVLLDVSMPDGDGPSFLEAIRMRQSADETAILFFTARVLPEERAMLESLGADGFIEKPFDPVELPQLVQFGLKSRETKSVGPTPASSGTLEAAVERVWRRHRASLVADIDRIDEYLTQWDASDTGATRTIQDAAHRLCGAFGVYGRAEASKSANELDNILRHPIADVARWRRAGELVSELRRQVLAD